MKGKERFLISIMGGKPDRIPIWDFLEGKRIFKEVLGKEVKLTTGSDIAECSLKLGFDALFVAYGGFCYSKNINIGDTYTDEWGVTYKNTGVSWPVDAPVDHPIKDEKDLNNWLKTKPDPYIDSRLDDVREALSKANDEIAVIGGVLGPLTTATLTLGFTGTLIRFVDEPEIVEKIFRVSRKRFHRSR